MANPAATNSAAALAAKSEPATLGEVTCFVSHSWEDELKAPGAKHAAFAAWARRQEASSGKEPTVWLVRALAPLLLRAPLRPAPPRRAQDKACIGQHDIDQALACLPVILAGCRNLLILAGPTYCNRLWVRSQPFGAFPRGAHSTWLIFPRCALVRACAPGSV